MYLGTLAAVRHRLSGGDFDKVPSLPEFPLNIENRHLDAGTDGRLGPGSADVSGLGVSKISLGSLAVPIYYFGAEGADINAAYPSLSYNVIDVKPRFAEYVIPTPDYGGEEYVIPFGAEETITDTDGTEATRAPMAKTRSPEQGYDLTVEVRVLCKSEILAALLIEHVYRVFPPRTYIRVPHKDGSYRSWDMNYLDFSNLDAREAVRSGLPGIEREYSRVVTYTVQGYADETDLVTYINIGKGRRVTYVPV